VLLKRSTLAATLLLLALPADAHAAFPGENGKIAFHSDRDGAFQIYAANPDGTGAAPLTSGANPNTEPAWSPDGQRIAFRCDYGGQPAACVTDGNGGGLQVPIWNDIAEGDLNYPAWSPDGSRLAFAWERYSCDDTGDCVLQNDLGIVNADGTGVTTFNAPLTTETYPAWHPDGSRIAFNLDSTIATIKPDWSGRTTIIPAGEDPDWAPDGSKIAYSRIVNYPNVEIFVADADGGNEVRLTNNTFLDALPAWSPDGKKIAFESNEGGDLEIFVMNSDGTGRTQVTNNSAVDGFPDWQPILRGYVRPKSASPTYISLAPAYEPCTAPNRTHGPPLAYGACAPPSRSSTALTLGTPDANGQPAKAIAYVRVATILGDPSTPADEADVSLAAGASDVRNASDLSDYGGSLEARLPIRITDRDNTPYPGGPGPGTVTDTAFSFDVPCAATADATVGATCAIVTTADAAVPGAVKELRRTVWGLGQAEMRDGDGDVFLAQGIFIP
jgi:TolB protein